jgi:hypothetical protein
MIQKPCIKEECLAYEEILNGYYIPFGENVIVTTRKCNAMNIKL